jgi:hypothetical protein
MFQIFSKMNPFNADFTKDHSKYLAQNQILILIFKTTKKWTPESVSQRDGRDKKIRKSIFNRGKLKQSF